MSSISNASPVSPVIVPVYDIIKDSKLGVIKMYNTYYQRFFIKENYITWIKTEYENLFNTLSSKVIAQDKLYFLPDLDFPRYKFKLLGDSLGANRTIKPESATIIVIKRGLLKEIISKFQWGATFQCTIDSGNSYQFPGNPTVFSEFINSDKLITPKDLVYNVFTDPKDDLLDRLTIFEYIVKNSSKFKFIDICDLQSQVSEISSIDITMSNVDTIIDLLKSTDQGNVDLGKEMFSNLDVIKAPYTCYYIACLFYFKLKYMQNVAIKGLFSILGSKVNDFFERLTQDNLATGEDFTRTFLKLFYGNTKDKVNERLNLITDFDKEFILKSLKRDIDTNLILKELDIEINYKQAEPEIQLEQEEQTIN